MNSPDDQPTITPRWAAEALAAQQPVSAAEQALLREILRAARAVRHGSILVSIQDGRAVQIDVTEKKRL